MSTCWLATRTDTPFSCCAWFKFLMDGMIMHVVCSKQCYKYIVLAYRCSSISSWVSLSVPQAYTAKHCNFAGHALYTPLFQMQKRQFVVHEQMG